MPSVPGTKVPESFYLVAREPAPLAGMEHPCGMDLSWTSLAELGIKYVVCLSDEPPGYDPWPLHSSASVRLQDLAGGVLPADPDAEERKIRLTVQTVLAHLRDRQGVVIHCEGGTGRTGTVLGCVLRGMGYPSEQVLAYLDRVTKARGRPGWPESEWQAAVVRGFVP